MLIYSNIFTYKVIESSFKYNIFVDVYQYQFYKIED